MKEPVADITLLVLLILFFGVQQRNRPQVYFRYWIVGWVLVFLAYIVWIRAVTNPLLGQIENVAEFDFMFLGLLTFLVSFLHGAEKLWSILRRGALVGVPVLLVIDARKFFFTPRPLVFVTVVLWQATGIWAVRQLVPPAKLRRRQAMEVLSVVLGIAVSIYVWKSEELYLDAFALSQVLLLTAMLYWTASKRRNLSAIVGTTGFILWAGSYLLSYFPPTPPNISVYVGLFWNFPKYFVGFSMILKVFEDASMEKSKLVEQYRLLYEDFRLIFESHLHPMWICEPERMRFLSANTSAILQYGYSEAEFKQMELDDLLEDPPGPQGGDMSVPLQHHHKNGSLTWVEITISWVGFQGKDACFVMARDVTLEKQQNDDLFHRAHHDVLTGLPNRTLLTERMEQCLMQCELDGYKAALLMIDVDHFKRVNDTFGHAVGDECLKMVAGRLAGKIRQEDTLGRVGGEEFAAVISGLHGAEEAERIAATLLQAFEAPLRLGGRDVPVTVSIGLAMYPDDAQSVEDLRLRSDEALYAAKASGRNRVALAGGVSAKRA